MLGVYAIERSYPKVGVGQMWKQAVKKIMHTFENFLNIVLTQMPTPTTGWKHKLSRDIVPVS